MAFDITRKNYLSWTLDAKIHLDAMGLRQTTKEENQESMQSHAKPMIFFHNHLYEGLKIEYIMLKDLVNLCKI